MICRSTPPKLNTTAEQAGPRSGRRCPARSRTNPIASSLLFVQRNTAAVVAVIWVMCSTTARSPRVKGIASTVSASSSSRQKPDTSSVLQLAIAANSLHIRGANVILFRPDVFRSAALSLSIQTDNARLPHLSGQHQTGDYGHAHRHRKMVQHDQGLWLHRA